VINMDSISEILYLEKLIKNILNRQTPRAIATIPEYNEAARAIGYPIPENE
jgi:hypothetical protein